MKYSYTSALRVNTTNLGGLERNLSRYSGGFDEVFFFSQYTHSVKNLEHHRAEAEKIRPYLRKLREMGIKAGINVLATTAFSRRRWTGRWRTRSCISAWTAGVFTRDSLEQELEHPLNMPGGHRRNLRQAFGWSIREGI